MNRPRSGILAKCDVSRLDHLLEARDGVFNSRDDLAERVDQVRQAAPSRAPRQAPPCSGSDSKAWAWQRRPPRRSRGPKSPRSPDPQTAWQPPAQMPGHRAHLCLGRHRRLAIDSGAHVMTLKNMKATTLPNGRYCAPAVSSQSTSVDDIGRSHLDRTVNKRIEVAAVWFANARPR